jgi:predicted dehydrogenase
VAPGNANGLCMRIYGTKGGLHWVQANPNEMFWSPLGKSTRIVTRGGPDAGEAAARVSRVPAGHPEGYLEGFANVYSDVALAIKAARTGKKPPKGAHFPTIEDGVKGLAFIEAAVKSSKANGKWVKL